MIIDASVVRGAFFPAEEQPQAQCPERSQELGVEPMAIDGNRYLDSEVALAKLTDAPPEPRDQLLGNGADLGPTQQKAPEAEAAHEALDAVDN